MWRRIGAGPGNLLFVCAVWTLLLSGCEAGTSELKQARIDDWLGCIDHCDDERDSVVALANSPGSVAELAEAVRGLTEERSRNMRRQFVEAYDRVPSDSLPRDDYVAFFLANYEAGVQVRAAVSLGDFADAGNPVALRILAEALREDSLGLRQYRPDVRRTIERVVTVRRGGPGLGGALEFDRGVAFLDTVVIREGPGTDFDGDEYVTLHGAPFGDDVTIRPPGWVDSVAFVAAGEVGTYALSVRNMQPAPMWIVDSVSIISFGYVPRPPTAPWDLGYGPFPARQYLALTEDAPDDYLRLLPNWNARAEVIADWSGSADILVHLDSCGAFSARPLEIALHTVDGNGDPLQGAQISLEGTPIGVTDQGGLFRVSASAVMALGSPPTVTVDAALPGFVGSARSLPTASGVTGVLLPLLPIGQHQPSFARPDTARAIIPAGGCWVIRAHRLSGPDDPSIVRLQVTLEPTTLDTDPPVIEAASPLPVLPPGPLTTSTWDVRFGLTISDQTVISRAELTVFVDGTDARGTGANGMCDIGSDYVLRPGVGEIDRNPTDYANGTNALDMSGPRAVSFSIRDPFSTGLGGNVRYCALLEAEDSAVDAGGTSAPNVDSFAYQTTVTWAP